MPVWTLPDSAQSGGGANCHGAEPGVRDAEVR
eukprot:CAMPEP_0171261698 /NCGR_PEP_ID=MMETSP0790-20130122/56141_1 /TAXON_ID=2925 /ORGANISM="Alexandrium catenella, Strain OF101" /LENGTH=31 /DNA_ID= /DNA_START= /DNA_END= /DNA_ORIENTATION=